METMEIDWWAIQPLKCALEDVKTVVVVVVMEGETTAIDECEATVSK